MFPLTFLAAVTIKPIYSHWDSGAMKDISKKLTIIEENKIK